jgi:hypothetical protein
VLPTNWRDVGARLLRYGRWVAPPVISVALVTWLIWKVTPRKLADAAATPAFPWLVAASVAQLLVLFVWDTVCVWWLFSRPDRRLPFRTVFRARVDTVIWSAINLEVGQAAFAWRLARATDDSVQRSLGRCLLLALFDTGTLQGLALAGSFLVDEPLIRWLRWVCAAIVAGLLLLVVVLKLLPARWYGALAAKDWARWLTWWTWRDAVILWALRLGMFLLMLAYAWVALAVCGIPVGIRTVLGVVPFVLVAEALPGTAGLGERETALVYLLHPAPEQRGVLLCLGLTWSVVTILGRVAIGLVGWLLPHPGAVAQAAAGRPLPTARREPA